MLENKEKLFKLDIIFFFNNSFYSANANGRSSKAVAICVKYVENSYLP